MFGVLVGGGRRLLGVPPVSEPGPADADADDGDARRRPREREARIRRLVPVVLATWFIAISAMRLVLVAPGGPGFDGRLYRSATVAWLARPGSLAGRPGRRLVRGAAAVADPDDPVRAPAREPRASG